MLSDKTKQHIETLLAGQSAYHPNTETQVVLAEKTLIMLIGPTGAGKSTVMREVTKLMPDISIVGTITTRPARPDDQLERYTFYDQTKDCKLCSMTSQPVASYNTPSTRTATTSTAAALVIIRPLSTSVIISQVSSAISNHTDLVASSRSRSPPKPEAGSSALTNASRRIIHSAHHAVLKLSPA